MLTGAVRSWVSAVGDSETQDFWTEFLSGLRERGLHGVPVVISDHYRGLMNVIGATVVGASWQRCRVHFMRNVVAKVPKGNTEMVAAAIRTVFAQPTAPRSRSLRPCSNRRSRSWRTCCARPVNRSPRSLTSPKPTGARCGARTRWSG